MRTRGSLTRRWIKDVVSIIHDIRVVVPIHGLVVQLLISAVVVTILQIWPSYYWNSRLEITSFSFVEYNLYTYLHTSTSTCEKTPRRKNGPFWRENFSRFVCRCVFFSSFLYFSSIVFVWSGLVEFKMKKKMYDINKGTLFHPRIRWSVRLRGKWRNGLSFK